MKTVKETIAEMKKLNEEKRKKGERVVSTFSRKGYSEMLRATLNDVDYESKKCTAVLGNDGKIKSVVEISKPVKEFREKLLFNIFSETMDKEDAKEKCKNYKFSQADIDTMYPIISDSIYNYMETGKRFTFIPKEDFVASIYLKDNPETVVTNSLTKTKTKKGAFKSLGKKSGTPSWLKTKI